MNSHTVARAERMDVTYPNPKRKRGNRLADASGCDSSRVSKICRALGVAVLALATVPFVITGASAQTANNRSAAQEHDANHKVPVVRELYVPYEDLEALLGSDTNRVFMTRQEYNDLQQAAKQDPVAKLPHQVALLSANYEADIRDGRAIMRGKLVIDVLGDGLHAVPLDFVGVGMRVATLDGAPAKLAKNDAGKTMLFVERAGTHTLDVELTMPVVTDVAQKTLKFGVPTAPSSRVTFSVPGNVEIKSGASVVDRRVDEDLDLTHFEIVPTSGVMSIAMSLNNRKTRDQNTVMARGVVVAEVTQGYERLHATMSMSVVNGASDELRFVVDNDLEVNSVACELLSRWEIETVGDEKQLVVKLRVPTTERVVVNVRMDRGRPKLQNWRFPKFSPLAVAGYTAVVGLVTEDRMRVSEIESKSLFTIDSQVLTRATASSMFAVEPGAPRVQAIAAFYAPSVDYDLSAQLKLPSRGLVVRANSLFTISDGGMSVAGALALTPENEKLFSFDLMIPPNWNLLSLRDANETELKFDRYPEDSGTRIRVMLPGGFEIDTAGVVRFTAQYTPPDWLGDWETQTIELPSFPVTETRQQQGVVAVQTMDDLDATPTLTEKLVIVSESEKANFELGNIPAALAYQYGSVDWKATLDLARITPRKTARVLSFIRIDTESLVVHSELIYLISEARSRTLHFSLPESTPSELSISALDGVRIKETSSSVVDGRRDWTVELADRHVGSVRLSVDFTQRLQSQEPKDTVLPVVRAEAVQYQTGAVAIEGHAELETTVKESPRTIDIGELVDAEYQVGKRLVGVYGYVADNDRVVIDISRRPIHALPSTIVARAEMVTQMSAQGRCQTAARFQLRTKATLLESRLPQDATLWSVMLDGKPALPQRVGDRVLITIPADAKAVVRNLQIVYETSTVAIGLQGEVQIAAPELFERVGRDVQGEPIPIADLKWHLNLPSGYHATRADGRVIATQLQSTSLETFFKTLWRLGGGTQSGLLSAVSASRESRVTTDSQFMYERVAAEYEGNEYTQQMEGPSSGRVSRRAPSQPTTAAPNAMPMEVGELSANQMDDLFGSPAPPSPAPMMDFIEPQAAPVVELGKQITLQSKEKAISKQAWVLEGVRSLAIDLTSTDDGETLELTGLGGQTETLVTMINQRRLDWLALAIGLLVFLVGLTRKTWSSRLSFLFLVILAAVLVPTLTGWTRELQSSQTAVLVAAFVLVIHKVLCSLWQSIGSRVLEDKDLANQPLASSRIVAPLLAFVLSIPLTFGDCHAQQVDPFEGKATTISSLDQLKDVLNALQQHGHERRGPVAIPENAVVVPYDSKQDPILSKDAEKLLVPYATYQRLWGLAYPDKKLQLTTPPAPFAWSDVAYTATLDRSGSLQMVGKLRLDQFVDGDLVIPLQLVGCVLQQATLDGKPARLTLVQPNVAPPPIPQQRAQAAATVVESGMLVLHTSGKGSKQIELRLQMKLDKSGGWRMTSGRIPSAPACALTISVDQADTEVRLGGMTDRASYLTTESNETLETSLAIDGAFSIQWRDKISEASIDQGLTVESKAVFDIREDAMRLVWQAELEFRRGRRESFTLVVPQDYLIEKVLGNNVRGWTAKPDERGQKLDIELLKPAVERESLTVILSKQEAILDTEPVSRSVPKVVVPDAMLQQGQFTVRRSSFLELRSGESTGLTRIDVPDESNWFAEFEEAGPLPMATYQAYRFAQSDFAIPLNASALAVKKTVEVQSLLKISQRETKYETRLLVTATDRPIHHLQIRLPESLELDTPKVPGDFQWAILEDANTQRFLEIDMADGQSGQFAIVVQGKLASISSNADPSAAATLSLPKLDVLDAQQRTGAIVVQVDPAYDIRATNLQACEVSLLSSVNHWLSSEQRQLARTVIRYSNPNYDGELVITPRAASVRSMSVTNIKVTDRAIEETVYIEATIDSAGISEFVFLLPASLRQARIQAPLIRQKTITPVDDSEGAPVRVKLELQDSIMGRFAVIVEHDRLLSLGPQAAPIPSIETGETATRIVTLENASRDELLTEAIVSMESLDRAELTKQGRLDRLGGKSSLVFRVQEEQAKAVLPRLTYQTNSRETIETSGARIGLAQTLLIVDELGTYRGMQEYHIENRTEPFLDVAMPVGSRLWTVQVAGENVKPSSSSSTTSGIVRVPLIKTAEGDLDYPVILKYGGQLRRPGGFEKVSFPLIKTVNINVELSQVRLRLPEDIHWFDFDGTMGRVLNEGDLQAGLLSFRTKQILDLTQMLRSSNGQYSKARAEVNLKQLGLAVNSYAAIADPNSSVQLQQEVASNSAALQQAQEQIFEFQNQSGASETETDNRLLLGGLYEMQANSRSLNVASSLKSNFYSYAVSDEPTQDMKEMAEAESRSSRFDSDWFDKSELAADKESKDENRFGNRAAIVPNASTAKPEAAKSKGAIDLPSVQSQPADESKPTQRDQSVQQQIAGDYRAQAERYSQKLQRSRDLAESNMNAEGQASMDMGMDSMQMGMSSGSGEGFGLGFAGEMGQSVPPTSPSAGKEVYFESEMDGAMGMGQMGGGGMGGAMNGDSISPDGAVPASTRDGFLASLEVELPVRGREYMFTTPGGDLELSARSVATDFQRRMISSLLILLSAIVIYVAYRVVRNRASKSSHSTLVSAALAIVGTLSVIAGFLPIYGVIAILVAITLYTSHRCESDPESGYTS